MFIEPNSVIRILKDVPLDNSYKNTLHFSSRTAQTNAMQSKTKQYITKSNIPKSGYWCYTSCTNS